MSNVISMNSVGARLTDSGHGSVYNLNGQPIRQVGNIPWDLLKDEKWRLHTFCKYPINSVKFAILLAADGFFYFGDGSNDTVMCFFCLKTHNNWRDGNVIHSIHAPDCPMITRVNCNNVPITVPEGGEQLFTVIEEEDSVSGHTMPADAADEVSDEANVEADAVSILNDSDINHVSTHRNRDTPAQLHNPSASAFQHSQEPAAASPRPSQMATMFVMSQDTSDNTTRSEQDSRATNPSVTAHEASDFTASAMFITSSNAVTSSGPVFQNRQTGGASQQYGGGQIEEPVRAASASTGSVTTASTVVTSTESASTVTTQGATAAVAITSTTFGTSTVSATTRATPADPARPAELTTPAPAGAETGQQAQHVSNSTGPSYQQLGIITERPKRFEYARRADRLRSFDEWPRGHHLRKEDLTDAGFYYAGYGDCSRCFYCGGGLRNWELTDNVWVEHARWFPKCAYLKQTKGQPFIDAVKRLNDEPREEISYEDVMRELGGTAAGEHLSRSEEPLERDAAVQAVTQMGYQREDALNAARALRTEEIPVSADRLFERLFETNMPQSDSQLEPPSHSVSSQHNDTRDRETMTTLSEQNNQLRQQTECKICRDKEVSIVFLPCGHFVSCSDCASALEACPVCRQVVRGIVRAFIT